MESTSETETPLFLIDTSTSALHEDEQTEGEESRSNAGEVELVVQHLQVLINAGIKENDVAIITPYAAQVQLLKQKFEEVCGNELVFFFSILLQSHPFLEIGTVDGFQGREKEVIIISMVRSNKQGEVGFLSDKRRTNVAITRAKRHVCVIADTTTLRTNPFLSRMTKYFEENADVHTADEYSL